MSRDIIQVKRLGSPQELRDRLAELGLADILGVDDEVDPAGPLAQPFSFRDAALGERAVGNGFTVLPMEGWDGTTGGRPTDLVRRRWQRFGGSGAKLVWGGEAVAVTPDARANPNQLVIGPDTIEDLAALRTGLVDAHRDAVGSDAGLVIGLQLTHSGRWSRPEGPFRPVIAHHHPVLDARVPPVEPMSDDDLDALVETFAAAALHAARAGFDFVDVKHCHGYLLHELLTAVDRPGRYGGAFEQRTAFLRRTVARIRELAPEIGVGVRLSAYDLVPFVPGPDGIGVPVEDPAAPRYAFGSSADGRSPDLAEAHRFLDLCRDLGIGLVCVTAGSPYYNPHIQRPAFFPPSDGYAPPEDPLVGAARMIGATAELARAHADLAVVGSGYSYLQQWLPHVGQHVVRTGGAASVGIGRGMLSYPTMPADVLAGRPLHTAGICRTFSDCTTAPRNGLVSGCYPLDEHYKHRPERIELARIKRAGRPKPRR